MRDDIMDQIGGAEAADRKRVGRLSRRICENDGGAGSSPKPAGGEPEVDNGPERSGDGVHPGNIHPTEAGSAENTARFKAIAQTSLIPPARCRQICRSWPEYHSRFITGLQSSEVECSAAAQSVAQRVTQAMQDALGIHSLRLSCVEQIGKNPMLWVV